MLLRLAGKIQSSSRAYSLFLTTVLFLLGVCYAVITPPFQVSDEPNHYYRAYQLGQGKVHGVEFEEDIGGDIPLSVFSAVTNFQYLKFQPELQTSYAEIAKAANEFPLETTRTTFADFRNTILYSPACYIPQIFAISLATKLNINPIYTLYFARIFTTFFVSLLYGLGFFFLVSIHKDFALALFLSYFIPMTAYQTGSISADSVLFAYTFLSFALVFALFQRFSSMKFYLLCATTIVLSLSKSIYFFLPLYWLIVFFPRAPWERKKIPAALLVLASILPLLAWNYYVRDGYRPGRTDVIINPGEQIQFLLSHPKTLLNFFKPNLELFKYLFSTFVGIFGWLNTSMPKWGLVAVVPLYISSAFLSYATVASFGRRLLFLSSAIWLIAGFTIISFVSYLVWTPVGASSVEGYQGRYFIPFVPNIIILLSVIFNIAANRIKIDLRFWRILGWISFLWIHSAALICIYTKFYKM